MSHWKSKLLDAYRIMTMPYRNYRMKQMVAQGSVPVAILFYHRVDNDHPNPWTISRDGFEEQLDWYQENFDLVSLEECQKRIRSGNNQRPTLSITFDDGYADNCAFALPMLLERKIPVTYFVTTYHTTQNKPFPHDVELGQSLAPNSPEALRAMAESGIEIGGHTRNHADLGSLTDPEELFDEVITATREMEQVIGKKIRYFAFPFGQVKNLNRSVFEMLKEEGFLGVCSAYGGMNEIGDDSFHLQRLHGDPNFSRMKNWLTFDPRLSSTERYDYGKEDNAETDSIVVSMDIATGDRSTESETCLDTTPASLHTMDPS